MHVLSTRGEFGELCGWSTLGGMMHVLVNLEGYMVGYLQVVQVRASIMASSRSRLDTSVSSSSPAVFGRMGLV